MKIIGKAYDHVLVPNALYILSLIVTIIMGKKETYPYFTKGENRMSERLS